jgi:replicative DNA helicase
MGKTALALNIAENVCFKNNLPVGIFSLEMTADQLLHRIICSQAEVESDKIRTGAINGIEFQRIVSSVGNMQKHTMIIDDSPGLKITDLRARARRMREAHGIEFLVIDYLQLLSGSGASRNQENRQMEVSEISRLLKTLARELNIPILCLSQLSRKVEERAGHRPMMSDLRESGCLTGDTEIKDAETGKIYTIKDLAERKVQTPIMVYGVDKDLKMGKHKMVKAFYSGKKTVYEMKTRTGRTIKASANHPFLKFVKETGSLKQHDEDDIEQTSHSSCTSCRRSRSSLSCLFSLIKNLLVKKSNWIRLDNLSPGDQIAIPSNTSDVHWDEIISITKLLVEDVYDATVEDVHNFVANDIVVHNSIEQDSDLVMFLLRREYYDPYDKPGTAELIVAKNRHGAIGNINFAFRKEIAQFADLSPVRHGGAPDNSEAFSAFSPSK